MRIVIESNGQDGYRVRAEDGSGNSQVIAFRPYTLREAVSMAGKALEVYNRDNGTDFRLRDVLAIDKEGVLSNTATDSLSEKMARRLADAPGGADGEGQMTHIAVGDIDVFRRQRKDFLDYEDIEEYIEDIVIILVLAFHGFSEEEARAACEDHMGFIEESFEEEMPADDCAAVIARG